MGMIKGWKCDKLCQHLMLLDFFLISWDKEWIVSHCLIVSNRKKRYRSSYDKINKWNYEGSNQS